MVYFIMGIISCDIRIGIIIKNIRFNNLDIDIYLMGSVNLCLRAHVKKPKKRNIL